MTGRIERINSDDFSKVDLHVHTPSSGCYKGPKTDKEYIEIIRKYVEKGVKVIAITDHNTLKGYKKINHVKQELEANIRVINNLMKDHPSLASELEKLENEYKLFKEIVILPGVEFEANPGIHMLLIFDLATNLTMVDNLLEEAGYSSEVQGVENPGVVSKFDVLEIMERASNLGAIIIASHADSTKGIYNDLKGQYRAEVFRSSHLRGISYNSPKTREKMEGLFQQVNYKRKEPVAFIQCSDYHGGSDKVANCITYAKLDEFSFRGIDNALRSPNSNISATISPKLKDIIAGIATDPHTVNFESFQDNMELIQQTACAILNDDYGSILIGVEPGIKKNIIGIKAEKDEITKNVLEILQSIQPRTPVFYAQGHNYQYGDRIVVLITLRKKTNQVSFLEQDQSTYVFDENRKIKKATPLEIAKIMEQSIMKSMEKFDEINEKKISNIMRELALLKNSKQKFALLNRIEKRCLKLFDIVDANLIAPNEGEFNIAFSGASSNGEAKGNTLIITRADPRLDDAYLRYSAPRTTKLDYTVTSLEKIKGKAILIAPGGGVYIVECEEEKAILSLDSKAPVVVLTIKKPFKELYSENTIGAWLKSDILLWYCGAILGDLNLNKLQILQQILIPVSSVLEPDNEIEKITTEIIEKELKLLELLQEKGLLEDMEDKSLIKLITEHNEKVGAHVQKIDKIIQKDLELSREESKVIEEFFELKEIYSIFENQSEDDRETESLVHTG